MKKIYSYAFAASVLMLASCSNETEPIVNGGGIDDTDASYMAVNICVPNEVATRAMENINPDGVSFENGTDEESAISANGTFLFFDGKGVQTQIPQSVPLNFNENKATTGAEIERVSDAIVVVAGRTQPTEVLVVLNDPGFDFAGKSKGEIMEMIAEKNINVATDKEFIMTNSSYYGTGSEGATTTITATDIVNHTYSSRKEAQKAADDGKAVNIYIERLAAKVTAREHGDGFKIQSTGNFTVNGEKDQWNLVPVLTGIEIANMADQEYLFKHIETSWISNWANVNDAANYRSNWAAMPNPENGLTYSNLSYNQITPSLTGGWDKTLEHKFYAKENTSAQKSCILLTAELHQGTADGPQVKALVRWAGIYFTPDNFKPQAASFLKGFYKEKVENGAKVKDQDGNQVYVALDGSDLEYYDEKMHELIWLGKLPFGENGANPTIAEGYPFMQYEQALYVKNDVEIYKVETDNEGNKTMVTKSDYAKEVNTALMAKENRCWYWNNGLTYYFLDIQHDGDFQAATEGNAGFDFRNGIVRNNVYKIALKNLSGLGVPIYNPDEVIIPIEPEDKLFYLAASVNILRWRIVTQEADFNNVPL